MYRSFIEHCNLPCTLPPNGVFNRIWRAVKPTTIRKAAPIENICARCIWLNEGGTKRFKLIFQKTDRYTEALLITALLWIYQERGGGMANCEWINTARVVRGKLDWKLSSSPPNERANIIPVNDPWRLSTHPIYEHRCLDIVCSNFEGKSSFRIILRFYRHAIIEICFSFKYCFIYRLRSLE